jgi:hypothetical protein
MQSQPTSQPVSPSTWIVVGTCVTAFLVLWFLNPYSSGYNQTRVSLWANMMEGYRRKDAEWGFGYAVLPAVLVLLWVTRDRYRDVTVKPAAAGLALILFALFLYYGGYKANQKFYGFAGGQIFVAGA